MHPVPDRYIEVKFHDDGARRMLLVAPVLIDVLNE
jgi:hypothetical protein